MKKLVVAAAIASLLGLGVVAMPSDAFAQAGGSVKAGKADTKEKKAAKEKGKKASDSKKKKSSSGKKSSKKAATK